MAKRSKDGIWERFSRTGVILILLYVMCIILGFAVRLLFFSDDHNTSIIPDNVVASAEGTSAETSGSTVSTNTESPAETNEHILGLEVQQDFLAVLIGDKVEVAVSMSTTGEADASDLTWNSSDSSIAFVDENGVITGVSKGTCDITVAVKGNESIAQTISVCVRQLDEKNGCTYIDGVLVVNKTYSLPSDYNPGLDDTVKEIFDEMAADAAEEGLNLYIGSSFRDYEYQVTIYNNYANLYGWELADTFSARPGHSEHQTGLTIDCNTIDDAFGETEEAAWLAEHCAEYGFIIRFPEGKEDITGYKYEPWHIRYVGVEVAEEINSLGVTLEEYLGVKSEYTEPWEES